MKDVENLLGFAIGKYGSLYGVTKTSIKQATFGKIEFQEELHTLRVIRDVLIEVGDILEEDLDSGCYIATVKAGVGSANTAIVVALVDGQVSFFGACAKEGLIKQSTAKKALEKIKKAVLKYTNLQ